MQLTKDFSLEELTYSYTALRNGFDNSAPNHIVIDKLQYLAEQCLQPLRDHFGEPIEVTSGYRGPEVNRAVNGSTSSHHLFGQAADIRFLPASSTGHTLMDIMEYAYANLPFTELILEEPRWGGWVHIAIAPGREDERQTKLKKIGSGVRKASMDEIREYWSSLR